MLSVCRATDTRGCGRRREGLYTHRGLAYSPRNVFDVLVYLYENYGALHACPDADSLTKRLTAAGFDDEIDGVRVYGPGPDARRTSLVSFTVKNIPSEEVSRFLAERGMFVSHGDFYASTVVKRYGIEDQGLVRIGLSFYSTPEEVERLLSAVAEFAALHD